MSERPKRAVAPKSYKEVGISSDESPEEKPATKRKLPRQTPAIESKPPPKKKPKTNPTVLSSSSSSTHISPKLPQIPYTLENASGNVRRWLKSQAKQLSTLSEVVTPVLPQSPARSIFELPVHGQRNFIVDKGPDLVASHRKLTNATPEPLSRINVWVIHFRDQNDPRGKVHEIFSDEGVDPNNYYTNMFVRGGILTEDICSSRADADMIAEAVIAVLDRIPWDLDAEVNRTSHCYGFARRIAVYCALPCLHDGVYFPTALIHPPVLRFLNFQLTLFWQTKRKARTLICNLPCISADDQGLILVQIQMVSADFDVAKAHLIPEIPEDSHFATDDDWEEPENAQDAMVYKLARYHQHTLSFKAGNPTQIRQNAANFNRRFKRADAKTADQRSSIYGGSSLFNIAITQRKVQISPSWPAGRTISGPLLNIFVGTTSKVQISSVLEAFLQGYLAENYLFGWVAAVIKADEINSGSQSVSKSIATHCNCASDIDQAKTPHICMGCWTPHMCYALRISNEDDRRLCATCAYGKQYVSDNFVARIRRSAIVRNLSVLCTQDKKKGLRPDTKEILKHIENFLDLDNAQWYDGYLEAYINEDNPLDLFTVWWEKLSSEMSASGSSTLQIRPVTASIEAIHRLVFVKGQPGYHEPSNIILTLRFINHLKGADVVAVMPVYRAAALLKLQELSERKAQDWSTINTALDHCHTLIQQYPYKLYQKAALGQISGARIKLLNAHARSGVFDVESLGASQSVCHTAVTRLKARKRDGNDLVVEHNRLHPAVLRSQDDRPLFVLWSQEEIDVIENIVRELETNSGRKLFRCNGVPWLWRPEHGFDNTNWNFLFVEFLGRWATLYYLCDAGNDEQNETPFTLFLDAIVQYFMQGVTGLRDPLLGMPLTVFARHPANYSIGRSPSVAPGSAMKTGWKTTNPQGMKDYDLHRRTIQFESRAVNFGKLDFAPELFEAMRAYLSKLPAKTKHYDELRADLDAIRYPNNWLKTMGRFTKRLQALLRVDLSQDIPIDEEHDEMDLDEDEDEDEEYYEEGIPDEEIELEDDDIDDDILQEVADG